MDAAVIEFTMAVDGMAAVAVGGYGREQLCLYSDIDLMLVVARRVNDAPPVFRALWDAGLAVGHAVRTPSEAMQAAAERTDTLCSLRDARLIGGDEEVFEALRAGIDRVTRPARLREALVAEELERRTREPYHAQALNLKSGRGGLRSIHMLRWLGTFDEELASAADGLQEVESRLLAARQALHGAAGRRQDVLDFSLRTPAASAAGMDTKAFLGEIYGAARIVDNSVTASLNVPAQAAEARSVGGRLFHSVRSRLSQRGSTSIHPWQLAAAAVERDPDGPALNDDEAGSIARFGGGLWDDAARDAFVRLAGSGPAGRRMFDQLTAAGFLDAALPEWGHVVSQAQLDPFHLHPVDDHLWRAAAEVLQLAGPASEEPWVREIAEELGSLDEVVLGALFHDIGKGTGGDHSEAGAELFGQFGARAGFDAVTVDVVRTLVRHHLLLPQVATRHDLDDPDVSAGVASLIADADVLRMLYLLTVADARATGPEVWTSWRASLIRTLFVRAMETITAAPAGPRPLRTARITEVTERLSDEIPADHIRDHLDAMSEAYALRTPASEVRRHLLLLTPPPAGNDIRIDVVDTEEWSDLVLVTADRAGLLAMVSGVLALSNISILEARLETRTDGVVVDRFNVVDSLNEGAIDGERWPTVLANLRAVLAGSLPLEERLATKHQHYRALVDGTVAPRARIIVGADHGTHRVELRGADRVGLLHDVSSVMHELEIDVRFAKIDTQGGRVVDTFHVFLPAGADFDTVASLLAAAARVPQG